MFVLMNASLAMAEWTGDTIAPQKANGYYLISKPEEYVWLGGNHLQIGDKAKLVADVIFGKDKNTVLSRFQTERSVPCIRSVIL